MKTCLLCDRESVGRGLCARHYYGAKAAGTLDSIVPKQLGPCNQCGAELPPTRRYGSRFCSPTCKDQFYAAANHSQAMARRVGRNCEQCHGPIPETAGNKARTCSRACSVAWQNAKRQATRRAEWNASRPPCARCGGPIGDNRRMGVTYCSPVCKKQTMDDRWRERAPGYMRQYLYGITPEQYAERLAAQDNRCAICNTDTPNGKGWHVDHDHATGAIRGVLCTSCNNGLGRFADDPARLRAAALYLERPSAGT